MGTKFCCKTSTTNPDNEMKFDDATIAAALKEREKNKVQVISSYFKIFALEANSSKVFIL